MQTTGSFLGVDADESAANRKTRMERAYVATSFLKTYKKKPTIIFNAHCVVLCSEIIFKQTRLRRTRRNLRFHYVPFRADRSGQFSSIRCVQRRHFRVRESCAVLHFFRLYYFYAGFEVPYIRPYFNQLKAP
jgi:hypothetical protein